MLKPTGRLSILSLVFVLAALPMAASGLVFSTPIAVLEDFEGEASFPAAPEIDVIGTSATTGWQDFPGVPTLLGSAAGIQVDASEFREGVELDLDDEQLSTLEFDVGLRSRFSDLSFTGDGEARVTQALRMALDDEPLQGTTVAAFVDLRRIGTFHLATLWILEEQVGTAVPDLLSVQSIPLSSTAADLLFAGADFTMDLEIDRAAALAHASLDIDGGPLFFSPALPLAYAHESSLTKVIQFAENRSGGTIDVSIDLDQYALFAAPAAYTALFNVDVGTFWDAPSPSYGAAGSPGVWNQLAVGSQSLVDLDGFPTSTTADLGASGLGLIEANGGDVRDLLADWARDPVGWTVELGGLPADGAYRVIFYTMGSGLAESGELHANGQMHPSLPGVGVPMLVEDASYAQVETLVMGGELDLAGVASGASGEAHLSGLQIQAAIPLPEPGLPTALMVGAAAFARCACRRGSIRSLAARS